MAEIGASVLVSVRDREKWVGEQIASLLAQWRADLELVVLDDGSVDGSFEAAQAAAALNPHVKVTLIRNERSLGMGALDRVMSHSKGRVIIFADSDDISLPGRLDAIQACFASDGQCKLVTSNAMVVSEDRTPIALLDTFWPSSVLDDPCEAFGKRGDARWLGATTAFDRSLVAEFPIDYSRCTDAFDLLIPPRATLTGRHHYISDPLILYRQHDGNLHRKGGAGSTDPRLMERSSSTEVMVLLQRLRDLRSPASASHPQLEYAFLRARDLLEDRLHEWSFRRAALKLIDGAVALASAPPLSPPAVVNLPFAHRLYANAGSSSGRLISAWSGLHEPEAGHTWSSRRALICLRVPDGKLLEVCITRDYELTHADVFARVGEDDWVSAERSAGEVVLRLPLTSPSSRSGDLVVLQLHAPGACRPCDLAIDNVDGRLLGVALLWLQVL